MNGEEYNSEFRIAPITLPFWKLSLSDARRF